MLEVMRVEAIENNSVYIVGSNQLRALIVAQRWGGGEITTSTKLQIGDLVLVAAVSGFFSDPALSVRSLTDLGDEGISHVILGLLPPTDWVEREDIKRLASG